MAARAKLSCRPSPTCNKMSSQHILFRMCSRMTIEVLIKFNMCCGLRGHNCRNLVIPVISFPLFPVIPPLITNLCPRQTAGASATNVAALQSPEMQRIDSSIWSFFEKQQGISDTLRVAHSEIWRLGLCREKKRRPHSKTILQLLPYPNRAANCTQISADADPGVLERFRRSRPILGLEICSMLRNVWLSLKTFAERWCPQDTSQWTRI